MLSVERMQTEKMRMLKPKELIELLSDSSEGSSKRIAQNALLINEGLSMHLKDSKVKNAYHGAARRTFGNCRDCHNAFYRLTMLQINKGKPICEIDTELSVDKVAEWLLAHPNGAKLDFVTDESYGKPIHVFTSKDDLMMNTKAADFRCAEKLLDYLKGNNCDIIIVPGLVVEGKQEHLAIEKTKTGLYVSRKHLSVN